MGRVFVTGATESAISDMQAYMDMLNPDIGTDPPKKSEMPADAASKPPPPPADQTPPPPPHNPGPQHAYKQHTVRKGLLGYCNSPSAPSASKLPGASAPQGAVVRRVPEGERQLAARGAQEQQEGGEYSGDELQT